MFPSSGLTHRSVRSIDIHIFQHLQRHLSGSIPAHVISIGNIRGKEPGVIRSFHITDKPSGYIDPINHCGAGLSGQRVQGTGR